MMCPRLPRRLRGKDSGLCLRTRFQNRCTRAMGTKSSWKVRWRWRWMRKGVGAKRRTALACLVRRVQVREGHLLLFDNGHQASLDRYIEAGHVRRVRSHSPTLILRVTTEIGLGPSSNLRGEGPLGHLLLRRRRAPRVGPGEVRFLPSASAILAEVGYLVVFPESRHLVKGF